jgi:hypothetical protein
LNKKWFSGQTIYPFLVLCTVLLGCNVETGRKGKKMSTDFTSICSTIPSSQWEILSNKKIFFAHQSVGFNIIDGITGIKNKMPSLNLNIIETRDVKNLNTPAFAHCRIEKNGEPDLKITDFQKIMKSGVGNSIDIALLKFCYVDITSKTDINAVFDSYSKTMDSLQKEFPNTKFVYCTVPLNVYRITIKDHIKRLIRRYDENDLNNMARTEFNRLIREKTTNTSLLFDLAHWESTYPDGSSETFSINGKSYESLIAAYSSDGGHLNTNGSDWIAGHLLVFLQNQFLNTGN